MAVAVTGAIFSDTTIVIRSEEGVPVVRSVKRPTPAVGKSATRKKSGYSIAAKRTVGFATSYELASRPVVLHRADTRTKRVRKRETQEILRRIEVWAGGRDEARSWFRSHPIPSLGGRTAEGLVRAGEAALVRDYLDRVALGGFA